MLEIRQINNRSRLAEYFSRDVYFHIYSLGDLDDFFWSQSRFFGLDQNGILEKVILLYSSEGLPVLLAFLDPERVSEPYVQQLLSVLPDRFYAHLSPGLEAVFEPTHTVQSHGEHYKMGLTDADIVTQYPIQGVIQLSMDDLDEIKTLYEQSYPGNWFNSRMLLTNQYVGVRHSGSLCSIAGVHVFSKTYQVAALGNITTHPDFRNQGLGTMVTAALCQSLLGEVKVIGLNVKQDNLPALSCYQKLGFEIAGAYGEFTLQKKKK